MAERRRPAGTRRQRRQDEEAMFQCALLTVLIIGLAVAILG